MGMGETKNTIFKKIQSHLDPTRTILLGFVVVILIGSFFISLPISNRDGRWLSYLDSLFTSTSAVCVTGLVVRDTAVQFTGFGQVIILLLIQIGGLGFMTVATLIFILMGKKITLRERLAIQESLVQFNLQGMVRLIRVIAVMTFTIEGIGALLLMITFIPDYGAQGIYMAIFHSVSAFCNAGFDLLGIASDPYRGFSIYKSNFIACFPLLMLIIIGGLGFTVLRDGISSRKWSRLNIHSKVVLLMTAFLIAFSTIFYLIAEFNNPATIGDMSFGYKLMNAFFQAVTPRTAGFSTLNQSGLTNASKLYTEIMMFIGASPGSTGGGIKTTVLFVIIVVVISNLRGRNQAIIDKQEIPQKKVMKAITIIVFASTVIFFSAIMVMLFEQGKDMMTFEKILFETVSAFGTVGLSMGITPYLSGFSKFIIILTMYLGRVGPLSVGVALAAKYSLNVNNNIKYSEAKIMVG